MKHLPILAAIGLGIVLLIQNGTTAGGDPAPRTVPVMIQDVMQPSRMVTGSLYHNAPNAARQIQVPLDPGQVFILTSWSVQGGPGPGMIYLIEGPTYATELVRDAIGIGTTSEIQAGHHVFPTGIRFARDAAGLADVYAYRGTNVAGTFMVQGYITDDF